MKNTDKLFYFFRGKIRLYQPPEYRLSVDLVIFLSKIKGIKRNSKVIDLGAGFGFIAISLAKKYGVKVVAFEVDKSMLKLLRKNVEINNLSSLVEVIGGDVREVKNFFERNSFDVVVANPPFFPKNYAPNPNPYQFELRGTLKDFIRAGSYLLRDGGYFNLLIPSFRLAEAFREMEIVNLPPRFLSLVYPTLNKKAKLSIITGIKNISGILDVDKPIVINREDGDYTDEVSNLLESFL